jgi:hypothetical protein
MKNSDTTGIFQAKSMPCERKIVAHRTKLQAAGDNETYQKILAFRRRQYRERYPDVALSEIDVHDSQSVILYTRDPDSGEIRSTARIAMDGKNGLPEENILRPILVRHGFTGNFAEIGRFIIDAQASNGELLKSYYRAFYHIAVAMDINAYLLVARRKEIPFYRKRINAHLLCDDIGTSFGSVEHRFCVLFWPIAQTGTAFLNWIK